MTTIETVTFRLNEGADPDELVALDARYQQEVAYQVPGLLRRTTATAAGGEWLVVTVWADRASADAAPRFSDSAVAREILALIGNVAVELYDTVS